MIRTSLSLAAAIVSIVTAGSAFAQTATPAPAPANLVSNGSFESTIRTQNLWTGVDSSGFLAGFTTQLRILGTNGGMALSPMPVSVAVVDLNGDKLPDIAAMDPLGFLRVYFNQGTATEPKFADAELVPIFLSRVSQSDPEIQDLVQMDVKGPDLRDIRKGSRINLADLSRSGRYDLYVGNYLGELMLIPNSGSPTKPDFRQPAAVRQVLVPTTKDPTTRWANLVSPFSYDWTQNGRDDLLLGEGSYSANSIHLLLNQGSSTRPVFNEDQRRIAAYGMGLEQLTPTMADYNGDGRPDLIVTERTGKVAVYLNEGKPNEPFQFLNFVPANQPISPAPAGTRKDPLDAAKATGLISVGGITTVSAGDLNGDGLFDLVFGKTNGRIAVSFNKGTKDKPVFAPPVELKTSGTPSKPFMPPSGWATEVGLGRGNFYGYITTVSAEDENDLNPPDQKRALKFGYFPSPNKIFPIPSNYLPMAPKFEFDRVPSLEIKDDDPFLQGPGNTFIVRQVVNIKPGKPYTISMRVKGTGSTNTSIRFNAWGMMIYDQRQVRGDRGSVSYRRDEERIADTELVPITVGPTWSEFRRDFTLKLTSPRAMKAAQEEKLPEGSTLTVTMGIVTMLSPGSGKLYIDDLKIIPK